MNQRRTKASAAQLSYLEEFMKSHTDMATCRIKSTLQGRLNIDNKWIVLAKKLNSLDGPMKPVSKWKQAWRDFKNNLKKKAALNPNVFDDPSTIKPVSEEQYEVFSIMDPETINGMENIVVAELEDTTHMSVQSSEPSQKFQLSGLPTELKSPAVNPKIGKLKYIPPKRAASLSRSSSEESDGNIYRDEKPKPLTWMIQYEERRLAMEERSTKALEGILKELAGIRKALEARKDMPAS